jgi:hypothetical protein
MVHNDGLAGLDGVGIVFDDQRGCRMPGSRWWRRSPSGLASSVS